MSNKPAQPPPAQPAPQPRKPYHTPKLEDYGAVNELTRSGNDDTQPLDGAIGYTSGANP